MPAAAVIPAPIAYIKVVAVKKLVVGFLSGAAGPNLVRASGPASAFPPGACLSLTWRGAAGDFYFEEIRVFTASMRLNILACENYTGP